VEGQLLCGKPVNGIVGVPTNVKREASSQFRNKKKVYLRDKIEKLITNRS
jgi:hypothetical protein